MPELPEVETIKRQLFGKIVGKKIKSVEVLTPRLIKAPLGNFKKAVLDSTIKNVQRRAKLLIIDLSSGYSLLIHLKMTGQLIYQLPRHPELVSGSHKHAHIVYTFSDGSKLFHNDLRKFGFVKLLKTEETPRYLEKEKYGPEPLEKKFTVGVFKNLLSTRLRQKIKSALMDQSFVAGIGNLYADEICFYAKVAPARIISDLKDAEIKKLFQGIKKILLQAIARHGSSVDKYVDAEGKQGEFAPFLKVYGREGEKCSRCGGTIKRIKLGGRGTHFCPKCQR